MKLWFIPSQRKVFNQIFQWHWMEMSIYYFDLLQTAEEEGYKLNEKGYSKIEESFTGNHIRLVYLNSNRISKKKLLLFCFDQQRYQSKTWMISSSSQILTLLGGWEWVTSKLSQKFFILFSTRWRTFSTSPAKLDLSKKNTSPPVSRNFCESRTSFLPGRRLSRFASLGSSLYHSLHWSGSNATIALVSDSENCNDEPGRIFQIYELLKITLSDYFKQQRTSREECHSCQDVPKTFNSILPNFEVIQSASDLVMCHTKMEASEARSHVSYFPK